QRSTAPCLICFPRGRMTNPFPMRFPVCPCAPRTNCPSSCRLSFSNRCADRFSSGNRFGASGICLVSGRRVSREWSAGLRHGGSRYGMFKGAVPEAGVPVVVSRRARLAMDGGDGGLALVSNAATVKVLRETLGTMNIHHLELFYY